MSLRAYRARLPLVRPLQLARGKVITTREVLLLERDGNWAEASPLPGFSAETMDDVIAELRAAPDTDQNNPSLLFARWCLDELPDTGVDCAISGLLTGEGEALLRSARHLRDTACPAAKLKVGGRPLAEELQRVRQVAEIVHGQVALRLDANRQWSLQDALQFAEATQDLSFDYVEEPVAPSDWSEIATRAPWRLARDESLYLHDNPVSADVDVNKPTLTGVPLAGVQSAAFESGVGLYRIAQLASRTPELPAGLDTWRWLANDVLKEPLCLDRWRLRLPHMPEVDRSQLREVSL